MLDIMIKTKKSLRALIIMGMVFTIISIIMLIGMRDPVYPLYFLVLGLGILIVSFLYMITEMMVKD